MVKGEARQQQHPPMAEPLIQTMIVSRRGKGVVVTAEKRTRNLFFMPPSVGVGIIRYLKRLSEPPAGI